VTGIYGVVAYSVSQRTREIGIRMALGAERSTVYQLILGEGGALIAIGVFFGLVCSCVSSILMHSLLFGVRSWDPGALISAAAVLAVSALVASYIPARRAASINPVDALRAE
jgi:ABC-type antimicrobial peptide transport system permease subunit